MRGPRFLDPFTLECRNDVAAVRFHDRRPAMFVAGLWGGVAAASLLVALGARVPARRPTGPWD